MSEPEKVYKCSDCDYKSNKIFNLKRHMVKIHVDKNKIVNVNNKISEEIINVNNEILERENSKKEILNNQCDKCNKTFCRKSYLKLHLEKCKGPKNVLQCDFCKRDFNNSTNKYKHQKICKAKAIVLAEKKEPEHIQQPQQIINNPQTAQTINNTTNNNITNNNTTNNINIVVYNQNDNIEFLNDHIDKKVLKKLVAISRNKTNRILLEYARTLMEKPENRCVRKKHMTNGFSEVFNGKDWDVASDREVYDKITNDIALSTSTKLDEHPELTCERIKNEIAEMCMDKHIMDKKYYPLFNLSRAQLISLVINITKNL